MQKYVELKHRDFILRGFHHDNSSKEIVVMLHGYTGNGAETKLLFKTLSGIFDDHNIDSLRMNFTGHGESDGQFRDIRIDDLVSQGELFINYAISLNYEKIHLLGFSMGGLISFNLLKSPIEKVVMISPAVEMPTRVVQQFEDLDPSVKSIDIGGLELKRDFYKSLLNYNIGKYASTFKGDILMTVGTKDIPVPYQGVVEAAKLFDNIKLHLFEGCDHLYSSLKFRDKLYDLIKDFLF